MSGEQDLGTLLAGLEPHLHPDLLVYASVDPGVPLPAVEAFAVIAEEEGTTLVLRAVDADAVELRPEFPCRRIELRVHSDLAAVGLTAAFATALADHGISANVIAGLNHDHLLVPEADADRAMTVLQDLQRAASTAQG
jgi:uncharacterized protein